MTAEAAMTTGANAADATSTSHGPPGLDCFQRRTVPRPVT